MGMLANQIAILCICVVAKVKTKHLHVKQSSAVLEDGIKMQDVFNYDDNFYTIQQDRFARHVELVTESVLEHVLKEINKKYPKNNKTHVPKMMQRLKIKIEKHISKKKRTKKKNNRTSVTATKKIDKYEIL